MGIIFMQMFGRLDGKDKGQSLSLAASEPHHNSRRPITSDETASAKRRRLLPPNAPEPPAQRLLSSPSTSSEERPPRHPDSPLSIPSTPSLSNEWSVPNQVLRRNLDKYVNEPFPASILADMSRKCEDDRHRTTEEEKEEWDEYSLYSAESYSTYLAESSALSCDDTCPLSVDVLDDGENSIDSTSGLFAPWSVPNQVFRRNLDKYVNEPLPASILADVSRKCEDERHRTTGEGEEEWDEYSTCSDESFVLRCDDTLTVDVLDEDDEKSIESTRDFFAPFLNWFSPQ